jgi:uncharacterized protein (TIGR02594 family)
MNITMDSRQFAAYQDALGDVGLREIPGPEHNPLILEMFRKVGASWFKQDEVPWCGAYVGAQLIDQGLPALPGGKSVTARAWHTEGWGRSVPIESAPKGAVISMRRGAYNGSSGHVAFLHRLIKDQAGKVTGFVLVGGNQGNAVTQRQYDRFDSQGRDLLLSARVWPGSPAPAAPSSRPSSSPGLTPVAQNGGIIAAIVLAVMALFGFGG